MGNWWTGLTEGQGAVISAGVTVVAAGVGVIIGARFFNGRVLNLREAITHSEEMLQGYRADMDRTLEKLSADLKSFQSMTQASLKGVEGTVEDLQANRATAEMSVAGEEDQLAAARREEIRKDWYPIRDHVERLATATDLEEVLRSKYARMDRRRYLEFIDSLMNDGVFGAKASLYVEAATLWQSFRGRGTPELEDIRRMRELRTELLTSG